MIETYDNLRNLDHKKVEVQYVDGLGKPVNGDVLPREMSVFPDEPPFGVCYLFKVYKFSLEYRRWFPDYVLIPVGVLERDGCLDDDLKKLFPDESLTTPAC